MRSLGLSRVLDQDKVYVSGSSDDDIVRDILRAATVIMRRTNQRTSERERTQSFTGDYS